MWFGRETRGVGVERGVGAAVGLGVEASSVGVGQGVGVGIGAGVGAHDRVEVPTKKRVNRMTNFFMGGILIQKQVELSLEADMSRPRAKRFVGMTIPQWGVLGVILLCMCGIVVGGYAWLSLQAAAASVPPELQIPVVTPPSTFTPAPTATATITPSPTPITYESLVPSGWVLFAGAGIEIYLPPTYALQTDEELARSVRLLGNEDAAPPLILGFMDTTPSPYKMTTTLQVLARSPFAPSLDEMVDVEFEQLSLDGRLLERDEFAFKLESYDARRLVFDYNIDGAYSGLAYYVIYTDNAVYYLGFITPFNELYTRLPDFDAAVQTFLVKSH